MAKVEITRVGFETLTILARYITEFVGEIDALTFADQLLTRTSERLAEYPLQCPVCHELEKIGVTDYRQLTVDKYKVLYRYNDIQDTVYVTGFMRHRQSAQELLLTYVLLNTG